jgi:imidazolonepropionase
MKASGVIAVLLPGTCLFLHTPRTRNQEPGTNLQSATSNLQSSIFNLQSSIRTPPISRMRELGITLALGSDFNPGSCTIFAMPTVISLACLLYGMTIKEAILGATLDAARALKLDDRKGSLAPGKDADILILDVPNYQHIAYRLAHNPVKTVIAGGQIASGS